VEEPGLTGTPEQFQRLQFFLKDGEAPVYMGWGSMTRIPPERILEVAIGALMECNMRGVINAGWVGLALNAIPDQALQKYAAERVCFVTTAPHAWLFPHCYCTVHHGGAGTTAASLLAGIPTIITPIVYDQFDHSRLVNTLGVGMGLEYLGQVTTEVLVRALRYVAVRRVRLKCAEVSRALNLEPGVWGAVAAIGGIIAGDVRTGAAKKRWEAELAGQVLPNTHTIKLPKQQRKGAGRFLREYKLGPPEGIQASDSEEDELEEMSPKGRKTSKDSPPERKPSLDSSSTERKPSKDSSSSK